MGHDLLRWAYMVPKNQLDEYEAKKHMGEKLEVPNGDIRERSSCLVATLARILSPEVMI